MNKRAVRVIADCKALDSSCTKKFMNKQVTDSQINTWWIMNNNSESVDNVSLFRN